MKAIWQERYGSALELREVDRPVPGDDEVLVRVHAAAVNARDWHIMRGDPMLARLAAPAVFGLRGPKNPVRGSDFAGIVEAVGSNVTRFAAGDAVYGDARATDGAFAEYIAVAESVVALKPKNLGFAEAAAVPLAATTALHALRDLNGSILINGASGGVGTFAVQLAKANGLTVTAVCSTRNTELVRGLGADRTVDYTREDFVALPQRYDTVLDLVGNRSLPELRRVCAPGGRIILSGGGVSRGGRPLVFGPFGLIIRGQLAKGVTVLDEAPPGSGHLDVLRELSESGRFRPMIDREFPLGDAAGAIRYVEVEHARAKVVVRCGDLP